MANIEKKLKIKFEEDKTVVLNGQEVLFSQWLIDFIIPYLKSMGAFEAGEE